MGLSIGSGAVDALYVGGSAVTRAYLDGEVVYPDSGGIAAWPTPVYLAHRGAMNIYPENTQEAFDYAVNAGYPIEFDVVQLSDGDFAVIHDTTMDRTTTSTGNVSSINRATFLAATCDASSWWGTNSSATLMALDQVLDRYGQATTYVIELKQGSASDLTTLLDGYAWAADYVVLASFTRATCENFVADGYEAMFLVPDSGVASSNTGATLLGLGINYVGVGAYGSGISDSTFSTYAATGIHVSAWTINSQSRRAELVTANVDGIITDDPVYTSGDSATYGRTTDPFDEGTYWPGHLGHDDVSGLLTPTPDTDNIDARGELVSNRLRLSRTGSADVWQGWVSPLPDTYTFTFKMAYDNVTDSTRWGGCFFSYTDDKTATQNLTSGTPTSDGYCVIYRSNGQMVLYRVTNGSATSLASRTLAAVNSGNSLTLEIDVTPTTITVTRTDVSAPNTVTATDSTYRGSYLAFRRTSPNEDSIDVDFYDCTLVT